MSLRSAAELRRRYAEKVCAAAGVRSARVADAFAAVPREAFLGPGPWQIAQPLDPAHPYRTTPDAALEHIYDDVVVAIDPARQINNGQPSAHALWIAAADPRPGEAVLHIGCGVGYYTAILASLVGESGRVVGCEIDPALAARAAELLAPWPQARALDGDASGALGDFDVLYVNAGATHARPEWLAALRPGGRLLLPLTAHLPMFPHGGVGFVLLAERRGARWPARVVSPVGIYDCAGARDPEAEAQVRKLLKPGTPQPRSLWTDAHARGEACLLHHDGFCLRADDEGV